MSAKKKMLSGDGWSFEPAGSADAKKEIVSLPPAEQRIGIAVEKRPKGKVATVVSGLVLSPADRKALARELKNSCGSGGTDYDDRIEVQGDRRDAVAAFLAGRGWKVR